MYIINGIAYAGEPCNEIEVKKVSALENMMLLITFNTGEKRLFDATSLLQYPAFKPLENEKTFMTAKVEHGVLVWLDGDIDIAPEALYENSFAYQDIVHVG
jgi:hypothetical protein